MRGFVVTSSHASVSSFKIEQMDQQTNSQSERHLHLSYVFNQKQISRNKNEARTAIKPRKTRRLHTATRMLVTANNLPSPPTSLR
jgi:hypothetical protein